MLVLQLDKITLKERLGPVSARVMAGELIHLVGPNGAGKSTLLACMAGLTRVAGQITLQTKPLEQWPATPLARHRAYLAQQQVPPFAMPVWHYLELHQKASGSDALMINLAQALQLVDKLRRPVSQLSGGEWQRVRLAAVLLQIHPDAHRDGQLLLLDEPMTSLDIAQQAALDTLLHTFSEAGIAVVMSSHDLNHSLRHAQQVWLLREGKMVAQGECEAVLTSENLAQAYGLAFSRLEVGGNKMLVTL